MFQTTAQAGPLNRNDHVWAPHPTPAGPGYKCLLCGGVTRARPPDFPTPWGWLPERYEPLTSAERGRCPAQVI
jgi:hypothetical protein